MSIQPVQPFDREVKAKLLGHVLESELLPKILLHVTYEGFWLIDGIQLSSLNPGESH